MGVSAKYRKSYVRLGRSVAVDCSRASPESQASRRFAGPEMRRSVSHSSRQKEGEVEGDEATYVKQIVVVVLACQLIRAEKL